MTKRRTNIWIEDSEGSQIATNIASYTSVPLGDGPGLVPIRWTTSGWITCQRHHTPVSPDGPTLTIRKFKEDPLTMINLIKWGTVNLRLAAMMWVWIEGLDSKPANFVIAGGLVRVR